MGLFSSIGSIFGSGGSWLGGIADGILGMNSANKANARKQANYNGQMQLALRQQQFNEDYARNVMQWRVEDAKKAGVHPMAALGMNSPSLGSVSMPSDIDTYNPIDMGQSTNYAATKAKTSPEQKKMVDLQIQGLELDNEYKQAQIDQMRVDTLASTIASDQALTSPGSPKVNAKSPFPEQEPPQNAALSLRHIRDNDYDINFNQEYQQELGDELGQLYNMVRKFSRENARIWTDPKTGIGYVFNRNSGYWNRIDALSSEEAQRLLGNDISTFSLGVHPASYHGLSGGAGDKRPRYGKHNPGPFRWKSWLED